MCVFDETEIAKRERERKRTRERETDRGLDFSQLLAQTFSPFFFHPLYVIVKAPSVVAEGCPRLLSYRVKVFFFLGERKNVHVDHAGSFILEKPPRNK